MLTASSQDPDVAMAESDVANKVSETVQKPDGIVDNVSESGGSRDGLEASKQAFLSSFTQADNKAIMRKVDRRFLLIIGMMVRHTHTKIYVHN